MPRSRLRRRAIHHAAVVAACLAIGLATLGCTSTITPPSDPREPVEAYLVEDYRHFGVVLRRSPGVLVEYGYGDWDWYAMMHARWYNVFDTVLWPTQGTLARREIRARDGAELRARIPWMEVRAIAVASEGARELLADLDAQWALREDEQHYNPVYKLSFVPHDDGFWFLHNCNDAVADWLHALDCSVSWVPIRLGLALTEE